MTRHRALLPLLAAAAFACSTTATGPRAGSVVGPAQQAEPGPVPAIFGPVAAEGAVEIRVFDVGQGDGIMIRVPGGKTVLVDAGTGKGGLRMAAALKRLGVTKVDMAIATHPHLDHMGGFLRLFDKVWVGRFYDPGVPESSKTYARLLQELETRRISVEPLRRGTTLDLGGGATLHVLAPEEPLFHGTRSDANANSIVLRLDVGDVCAVLTGDAEAETEERVAASGENIRCPVLKVAHHGGHYSTTDDWLSRVQPDLAVISVGARNRYGHPHEDTLRRLEGVGARVYRTDRHGTVVIRTDGERIMVIVENEQAPAGPAAAVEGASR